MWKHALFLWLGTYEQFLYQYFGTEFGSEEKHIHVLPKAGKSMLLIFNHNKTFANDANNDTSTKLRINGANTPSVVQFALQIQRETMCC